MKTLKSITQEWIKTKNDKEFIEDFKSIKTFKPLQLNDNDEIFTDGKGNSVTDLYSLVDKKFSYNDLEYLVDFKKTCQEIFL